MIITRKAYQAKLEDARREGHAAGASQLPSVFVAAHGLAAAREAARKVEHPDGGRGAVFVRTPDDLVGHRGGVLLRGWGTDDELVREAHVRGILVIDAF